MNADAPFLVLCEPHWGGDADQYTGRLVVEVTRSKDAAHLAAVGRALRSGNPERLARLAALAERIMAEDEASLDPVLC